MSLVAGIDLGSTGMKLLVSELDGREVLTEQVATPWRSGPGGTTEMDAAPLLGAVRRLLDLGAARLADRPDPRVVSVAVSGMGETGMLVDARGHAVGPAFAWFDPRGAEQAARFPAEVRATFAGRTGLPLGAQVSVAKLAYLRDQGLRLRGLRWLNLPEFVVASLGGDTRLERSLTSRTGLLDQDTGEAWPAMLDVLGVDATFLPEQVDAGSAFGRLSADLPSAFAGALVTVAGHDHLVAAEADHPLPQDHYHVSLGTAEVLLRIIDHPLGFEARARLAEHLINEVRHVVPGKHVLVAGVKTGLLLRRALQAAGIHDRSGRDQLDAAAAALPYEGLLAARLHRGHRGPQRRRRARADPALRRGHPGRDLQRGPAAQQRRDLPADRRHGRGAAAGAQQHAHRRLGRHGVRAPGPRTRAAADGHVGAAAGDRVRRLPVRGPAARRARARPLNLSTHLTDRKPMNPLNTLERRGMAAISTDAGSMLIVAADQRNSMKAVMTDAPDGPGSIPTTELAAAKADLITFLASSAPAILLDPEVALPGVVDDGVLPRGTALVVGMDASGNEVVDGLRYTRFVDGITPRRGP